MPETNIPRPLNKTIRKMQEGLGFTAIKSGNNWMLPLGQDAAEGQYVVLNGVIGKASAAIVGGVDAVVSGTNWDPEDDGGALNELNSKIAQHKILYVKNYSITLRSDSSTGALYPPTITGNVVTRTNMVGVYAIPSGAQITGSGKTSDGDPFFVTNGSPNIAYNFNFIFFYE